MRLIACFAFLSLLATSSFAISNGDTIIIRQGVGHYKSCYVQKVDTDGNVELYCSGETITSKASALQIVTQLSSTTVTIQYLDGTRAVEVRQDTDILTRLGATSYQSQYVSAIYSDGVLALYNRSSGATTYLTREEVSARMVQSLSSVGSIRADTDIIERDSDRHYVTYYVSALYSDGVAALYNRSSGQTVYRSLTVTNQTGVTPISSLAVPIQTMDGVRNSVVRSDTDVILRLAPGSYQTHYVSTIYSDEVVSLYNRATGQTSYLTKSELGEKLVEAVSQVGPIRVDTDVIQRDETKRYVTYYVSAIYSDGVAALYNRSSGATIFRSLVDATAKDVTTLSSLSVPIDTMSGARGTTVRADTDVILRLGVGQYQSHYVSTIYSDEVFSLYNRSSGGTTLLRKDELSPILVETMGSVGRLKVDSKIALATAAGSLERAEYYVSSLYTDGVAALYGYETGATTFTPSQALSGEFIAVVSKLDGLADGGIYLVRDAAGKESKVYVVSLYEDQVARLVTLSGKKIDRKKSRFVRISDFTVGSVLCDPAKNEGSCARWWEKHGEDPAQPNPPATPNPPNNPEQPGKPARRGD